MIDKENKLILGAVIKFRINRPQSDERPLVIQLVIDINNIILIIILIIFCAYSYLEIYQLHADYRFFEFVHKLRFFFWKL